MRVSLVSTVNLSNWYSAEVEPAELGLPLGLLSLASVLDPVKHQISFVDINYALSQGAVSIDDHFYRTAADLIAAESPQIIGFSTMANSYHITLRMAETVRTRLPGVPIVLGGPHASVVDVQTLEAFQFVDMVLRGEAEETFPVLLEALSCGKMPSQLPGLTHRQNGLIVRHPDPQPIPNLDLLPIPAYHLFPYGIGRSADIEVGRGCPFSCTFCSTSKFWRRKFRLKSADRIINEISYLKQTHAVQDFCFVHDLFTYNRPWLVAFCGNLQEHNMDITWGCSARIDSMDSDLLRSMVDSGCQGVYYGIETGSERMQREINKNLRLDRIWSTIDQTLESGMDVTLSFIVGFPTETEDDIRQTMDMIQRLIGRPKVTMQLHMLSPQAGTLDWERYGHLFRIDGHYSDLSETSTTLLEDEWFRKHPLLFSTFYYFDSDGLSRSLLRGLDSFVYGPC